MGPGVFSCMGNPPVPSEHSLDGYLARRCGPGVFSCMGNPPVPSEHSLRLFCSTGDFSGLQEPFPFSGARC